MKSSSALFAVTARYVLCSSGFWIGACGENSMQAESLDSIANATAAQQEASPPEKQGAVGETSNGNLANTDEQITELRREIESGRQNIENIEAFAQMERAKLEDDPDYDQSFLLEAIEEQQELREAIESDEIRLQELTRQNE